MSKYRIRYSKPFWWVWYRFNRDYSGYMLFESIGDALDAAHIRGRPVRLLQPEEVADRFAKWQPK